MLGEGASTEVLPGDPPPDPRPWHLDFPIQCGVVWGVCQHDGHRFLPDSEDPSEQMLCDARVYRVIWAVVCRDESEIDALTALLVLYHLVEVDHMGLCSDRIVPVWACEQMQFGRIRGAQGRLDALHGRRV